MARRGWRGLKVDGDLAEAVRNQRPLAPQRAPFGVDLALVGSGEGAVGEAERRGFDQFAAVGTQRVEQAAATGRFQREREAPVRRGHRDRCGGERDGTGGGEQEDGSFHVVTSCVKHR